MQETTKFKAGDKVRINPSTKESELMLSMFGEEDYKPTAFYFNEIMSNTGVVARFIRSELGPNGYIEVDFSTLRWREISKPLPQTWVIGKELLILAE